jgi:phosphoribosyl 1,2-cyclic phosphate phosphodiesterase
MLRENVRRVDAIIFTHAHRDHTAGLDDVRAYNFLQGMDMPIYATDHTLDQLKIEYAYVFDKDSYPGIPRLALNEINDQPFNINGVNIVPLPVLHMKMPVLGFRFENLSYITDANFIPDSTLEKLAGTEVLVLNALQVDPHISHFNLDSAIRMADRIRPAKTFFTHISHKLGLHSAIEKNLPPNTFLAFDGLEFSM